jgi:response regulator RpfG family c-di-GMP phosphodiesterase
LNKPYESEELKQVLTLAVRQYELVTAEKELLEQTLKGSIKVLADLLGIAKPEAFGRTARLRRKARELAARFPSVKIWELDTAALLSQLGCVNVAQEILDKRQRGEALNERDESAFASHPLLGADLISRIPRLERVGKIVREDIKTDDGIMLLCHGHEVTPAIREHLVKFQKMGALTKRILVAKPRRTATAQAVE